MFALALALLSLTACKPVEPDPLAVAPDETIRPLAGPWSVGGANLALASGTALSAEAGPGGAGVAMAAWTREGQLWLSSTFNAGAAWTTPRSLGPAPTGDAPPTLLVSPVGLALAFVLDGRPTRLVMTDRGFVPSSPAEAAVAHHVTAVDHEGTIWLAWVDHRDPASPTLRAWTDGEEELILQDVPICDGPIALGVVDGALTVAARLGRDAGSGVRTFARGEEGWTPRGAWLEDAAPCFSDAPFFAGEELLTTLRAPTPTVARGDRRSYLPAGALPMTPRPLRASTAWAQEQGGRATLVIDGLPQREREGTLRLGAPAIVGPEVWLPMEGGGAAALAWRPED
ncbi:MAG: hypothetical protein IPO67_12735 [Deltaproteobacteria bacterium]|nr:hypothetical protein [Deltaproteobacteria bacterium]